MTLVKFNQPVTRNFNGLMDELFNELPNAFGKGLKNNSFNFPPVNITEAKEAYLLEFNVPGRNKEDFKINLEDKLLIVSYEMNEVKPAEDTKKIRSEFSLQSFKRSFTLDEKIAADKIDAKYENGILKLTLPKVEEVKTAPTKIAVQ